MSQVKSQTWKSENRNKIERPPIYLYSKRVLYKFSYLIWPEAGRDPRVLFKRASAVIVALWVPLMMHQGFLKGEARRSRLHGTLERFLVRRTSGPALESHGHGHRRTRTEAESRGTSRLRRGPLMLLSGTPAASAHLPEIRIENSGLE